MAIEVAPPIHRLATGPVADTGQEWLSIKSRRGLLHRRVILPTRHFQYFLTVPRELDEAATIDGAGPFRTLWSVILPQMKPAIVAVSLFHFYFAWNDFFEPMIYLSTRPELQPISVGLRTFNTLYDSQPNLIQSGAMLALIVPVLVFLLAQRVFLQGIDLSGVQK
jgi:multiple sugar transport system permease protein